MRKIFCKSPGPLDEVFLWVIQVFRKISCLEHGHTTEEPYVKGASERHVCKAPTVPISLPSSGVETGGLIVKTTSQYLLMEGCDRPDACA